MKLHLPVPLARLVVLAAFCQAQAADITWNVDSGTEVRIISESNPLVFPTDGDIIKTGDGRLYISLTENPSEGVSPEAADAATASDFAGDVYVNEGDLVLGANDTAGLGSNVYLSPDVLGSTGTIHVAKDAELLLTITQDGTVDFSKAISLEGGWLWVSDGNYNFEGGITLTEDSTIHNLWGKTIVINGLDTAGHELTLSNVYGGTTHFKGEVSASSIAIAKACTVTFDQNQGLKSLNVDNLTVGDESTLELRFSRNDATHFNSVSLGANTTLRSYDGDYTMDVLTLTGDANINLTRNKTITVNKLDAAGHTLTITRDSNSYGPHSFKLEGDASAKEIILKGKVNAEIHDAWSTLSIDTITLTSGANLSLSQSNYTPWGHIFAVGMINVESGSTLHVGIGSGFGGKVTLYGGGSIDLENGNGWYNTFGDTIYVEATTDNHAYIKGSLYGELSTVNGNIIGTGTLELRMRDDGSTNTVAINAVISDKEAGQLSLVQSSGSYALHNVNTFSGGTTLSGGHTWATSNGVFGTGDVSVRGGWLTVSTGNAPLVWDNTFIVQNTKGEAIVTFGATGATYHDGLNVTTASLYGGSIEGASIDVSGEYSINSTSLSGTTITVQESGELTFTNTNLNGINTLNVVHAVDEGSCELDSETYTLISTNALSGATLTGSLTIDFADAVLDSYGEDTLLAIRLDGLSGPSLTLTNFSVTSAIEQKFGFVEAVSTTQSGVMLYLADGAKLTWAGGSGEWNKVNSNWISQAGNASSYSDDVYVDFLQGSSASSVALMEAVSAKRVTVMGGEYDFTNAGMLTINNGLELQSANGVPAVVSFDVSPVFASTAGISIADATSSLTVTNGDVSVKSFINKGTVTLAAGKLTVGSAVTEGGTLSAAGLTLADSSSNSFKKLVSTGTVSYAGAAGSLSVGDGSQLGALSGGSLDVAGGSVAITGTGQTSLTSLTGTGKLSLNGGLALAEASSLAGDLNVAGTLALEATLSLGGNLTAAGVHLGQLSDTPLLQAAGLAGAAVDFTLSSSAVNYLQELSLTSGQTCTLASLTNGAGSTALTINGSQELVLGLYSYTISEAADSHDIILTAGLHNVFVWSSTDGVWNDAADWSGALPGAADTIALQGGGTADIHLTQDETVHGLVVEHQRDTAYRLTGESLSMGDLYVRQGGLEIANESTTLTGSVIISKDASLAVEAGSHLAAADMHVMAEQGFINAGTTVLSGALSAENVSVVNSGSLTVGSGKSTIGALVTRARLGAGDFHVAAGGEVDILGDSSVGYLGNAGVISMAGHDLSLGESTQQGGQLSVENLTLAGGDNAFGKLEAANVYNNTGSLALGDGSNISETLAGGGALAVDGAVRINKLESPVAQLHIAQGGSLGINTSLTVKGNFSSQGMLNAEGQALTFTTPVAEGGNVTAKELVLSSSGNSFADVTVSTLTFVGAPGANRVLLSVQSLTAAGEGGIAINFDSAVGDVGNYLLVDSASGLSSVAFTLNSDIVASYLSQNIEASLVRGDNGAIYLKLADRDPEYYAHHAGSVNGQAAGSLLDHVRMANKPAADTDLGRLISALEDSIDAGASPAQVDALTASVGGVSIPTLSLALAGDVHRQLRSIRNRTTTMGVDNRYEHPEMPYVNAWINAEGDYREMEDDGTAAGYSLSSWGGTVGVDVDMAENLTLGFACTALYGDFSATGADDAEGDMDSYYASFFARLAQRRWVHTFVMTAGLSDISLDRTVSHAAGSYQTTGSTDGLSLGALYEVAYTVRLSEDDSVCWQPVANVSFVHATVDGYDESGSDAALRAGEQDFTQFTLGLGARLQAVVGENLYNRASILELRALAKVDMGDREGRADIAFASLPGQRVGMSSNEYGAVGVELGAGITIPVSADSGELFFDASAELRGGQSEVSGAAGWRVHF